MQLLSPENINDFLVESKKIEGITFPPTEEEIRWVDALLSVHPLTINHLKQYVFSFCGGAQLRTGPDMNVRVGSYIPPAGGPHLTADFINLIDNVNQGKFRPYEVHCRYERLHPFMDGNGRSGRLVWLWQHCQTQAYYPSLGFLHQFYYETLKYSKPLWDYDAE